MSTWLKCHHRSTLNKQAVCYFETLIINQNIRRHTPDDRSLRSHCPLMPAFASLSYSIVSQLAAPRRAAPVPRRSHAPVPYCPTSHSFLQLSHVVQKLKQFDLHASSSHSDNVNADSVLLHKSCTLYFLKRLLAHRDAAVVKWTCNLIWRECQGIEIVVSRQWAGRQRNRTSSPNRGQNCFPMASRTAAGPRSLLSGGWPRRSYRSEVCMEPFLYSPTRFNSVGLN